MNCLYNLLNMYFAAKIRLLLTISIVFLFFTACHKDEEPTYPQTDRHDRIPADAVKVTPATDLYPPILHSAEYEEPVPLGPEINTAGAEDSPFIPADRDELYFFFTPDANVPPGEQVKDNVSGIYVSTKNGNGWSEAKRVWLQDPGKLALDGAEFVTGNHMLFVSARESYTGLHWFSAVFENNLWSHWEPVNFDSSYQVGELHIYGNELYYHSSRSGSIGKTDIWMLENVNGNWQNPVNITAVNTAEDDCLPYITPDGSEMWFSRFCDSSPAIYRSKRIDGVWQEPELIISRFAGEPTLDRDGNIYFVHHFYKNDTMIEADIYVARKK